MTILNIMLSPYNAVGDGTTDDSAAIQAAIDDAQAALTAFGTPTKTVYAPAGYVFKIGTGLTVTSPINLDIQSVLKYPNNSGSAFTIGTQYGWANYYSIKIEGIICTGSTASGAFPSSINSGGAIGLRVNHLTFSRVYVGIIQGFSKAAVYLDGTGAEGYQQVIQHNRFDFNQIANNGLGIYMASTDAATSSVQANRFDVQNVYQNFINVQLDGVASDSNTFNINAADNHSADGHCILHFGCWNTFNVGYMDGRIYTLSNSTSGYNTFRVGNTSATGVQIYKHASPTDVYHLAGVQV